MSIDKAVGRDQGMGRDFETGSDLMMGCNQEIGCGLVMGHCQGMDCDLKMGSDNTKCSNQAMPRRWADLRMGRYLMMSRNLMMHSGQ